MTGHASLIKEFKQDCDRLVPELFVFSCQKWYPCLSSFLSDHSILSESMDIYSDCGQRLLSEELSHNK